MFKTPSFKHCLEFFLHLDEQEHIQVFDKDKQKRDIFSSAASIFIYSKKKLSILAVSVL